MRQGIRIGRVCALVVGVLMASAVMATTASAGSLGIVAGKPAKSFIEGTDFLEGTHSAEGHVTAPLTAVDLRDPGPAIHSSTSGCEASDFAGFPVGDIALIQRGTCLFQTKAHNATAAGAAGVIIYNEGQPGRTALQVGNLLTDQSIPVVFASFAVGTELRNGVYAGPTGLVVDLMTDGTTDVTPPVLDLPAEVVVDATSPSGAVVTYVVSATDDFDPEPFVTCAPASGSSFPIGTSTVECSATDDVGNSSSGSFTVIVKDAAAQTVDLIEEIEQSDLPGGTKASLNSKLEAAQASMERGNTIAACNMLDAFEREVRAQSGRNIPEPEATALLEEAAAIKQALGC